MITSKVGIIVLLRGNVRVSRGVCGPRQVNGEGQWNTVFPAAREPIKVMPICLMWGTKIQPLCLSWDNAERPSQSKLCTVLAEASYDSITVFSFQACFSHCSRVLSPRVPPSQSPKYKSVIVCFLGTAPYIIQWFIF